MSQQRIARHVRRLIGVWVAVHGICVAGAAAGERATITGGADVSGHHYSWTVTNQSTSPIVEVRFPHYRVSLFFAPEGWTTQCTAQVGVGVKDQPGLCTAQTESPRDAIPPGRSAVFQMQIASAGAKRLAGTVRVRFADSAEAAIAGVELPTRESSGDKYVSLVGLGLIFIVLAVVQARRRRSVATRDNSR